MDRYNIEPNDKSILVKYKEGALIKVKDVEARLEEIKEAQGPNCVIPEELFEI